MSGGTCAGVVGDPIDHSLSPVLHAAAYAALELADWDYQRIRCDADGFAAMVKGLGPEWAGLSVTMPCKRAALHHADAVTSRAAAVGAANTLVRKTIDGADEWHADCTDVDGVIGALRCAAGFDGGRCGLVLGAGGTAAAAVVALAELGVEEVTLVVRDPARAEQTAATADQAELAVQVLPWADADFARLARRADVLVSTVPADAVAPVTGDLTAAGAVLDVIYHPWPTPLGLAVDRLGTGLDMLLHQAFGQVEQFTGRAAPRERMRAALRAATGTSLDLPVHP